MSYLVSFIIPHKGREEMLWQTVASISKQSIPKDKVQVIILSQNESLSLPDEYQLLNCQIKLMPEFHTISALRNKGAKTATGEYLAFLDADVELSKNWTQSLVGLLQEEPQRILVSAMQTNSNAAPPLEKIRTCLSNADIDCNLSFMPGRNLLIRRKDFFKTPGFPEHLTTCEDYYFTNYLTKLGDIFYSSTAQYIHLGEDKLYGPMFKKEIWRGQSNLLSIQGRKPPIREIPSFILPLAIPFFFILSIYCYAMDSYLASTSLLLLSLLPIIAYSLRLLSLSKFTINIADITKFYLVYFPARSIGSVQGLFYWLKNKKYSPND